MSGHKRGPDVASKVVRAQGSVTPHHGSENASSEGAARPVDLNKVINYRTCTWKKTAALLAAQYIALPVMSFPASYAVLGLVPALLLTLAVAATVFYTSMITWRLCLRYPHVKDICDVGQLIFWDSRVMWYLTAIMFVLNNAFVAGIHVLIGARYLETMSSRNMCNVAWTAIFTVISFVCAIPRTFATLSRAALATAVFTFVSILLAIIFSAAQGHPAGYDTGDSNDGPTMIGEPVFRSFTPTNTTWVAAVNAFLNISYTFIGQTTLPSYIAEMARPQDFPKALIAVTLFEVVLFTITGAVIYVCVGSQYITSPAFSSLENMVLMKLSFSFMLPTLIFTRSLYSSISGRFIFFRLFEKSRHKNHHTVVGWVSWIGILFGLWALTFLIAELIPFFGDLLSLMSAIFDSNFGFIYWAVADMRMREIDLRSFSAIAQNPRNLEFLIINTLLVLVGLFMLGVGSYTSIDGIILDFQRGNVRNVFSCATDPY